MNNLTLFNTIIYVNKECDIFLNSILANSLIVRQTPLCEKKSHIF